MVFLRGKLTVLLKNNRLFIDADPLLIYFWFNFYHNKLNSADLYKDIINYLQIWKMYF